MQQYEATGDLDWIQCRLGHVWKNKDLLIRAFSHTSWCNEQEDCPEANERLEFLGDSVLDLVTAEFLMMNLPEAREGRMSQVRAGIVKTDSLAEVAKSLNLGDYLRVGRGAQNIKSVKGVLADTMEAIIGAAYIDGGIAAARSVIVMSGIIDTRSFK